MKLETIFKYYLRPCLEKCHISYGIYAPFLDKKLINSLFAQGIHNVASSVLAFANAS